MPEQSVKNPRGALPFGTVIGGAYEIGAFISADGEGVLYEAIRRDDHQMCTIKEYLPLTLTEDRKNEGAIAPKEGSEVMFKTTRMDFADLYRAIQGITPTVGLETVLDVIECNNTVYAVMENLGGVPLSQYMQEHGGKLPQDKALALLNPVFEGVSAMHVVGLVHRGVSPENIIVHRGKARLTGYATIDLRTGGSALRAQLYEGYSAPEQYSAADFEGRYTDAYGLAAVFYYLITGRAPVSAGQRLVSDANPAARSVNAAVPHVLSDVLVLALRMKPAERIQTVTKLQQCLASGETARAVLLAKKRARKKKHNLTGVLGIALIVVAALLCFVLWFGLSRGNSAEELEPTPTIEPTATPVPVVKADDFIGMTFSQVQQSELYTEGYLFYITEAYSATAEVGTIIEQTPAAGEAFEEGTRRIDLVVSLGPEMVEVPELFGYTQDGATKQLEALGLTVSFVMQLNDGSYASGCVVKTAPAAGSEVKVNTTITVYIAADRDVEVIATPEPEPTATPEPTAPPEATPTPSTGDATTG